MTQRRAIGTRRQLPKQTHLQGALSAGGRRWQDSLSLLLRGRWVRR